MPALVKIGEGAVPPMGLFSEINGLLFEIHPPQRRFKWKKQQINQLWDDLVTASNDARDSYFLGTLLLVELGDGRVSVIDGQQRISTLSLLLAVLRDHCRKFSDLSERAGGIQRLLSRVDNDGNPIGSLVVTLQEPDKQTYIDLVKQPGSTESLPGQPSLLSSAVKLLRENVTSHINVPDPQEKLRNLCEFIQTKVMFLPLGVGNEGEGYLVFDTTNTRGLILTPSEALKARLATVARQDSDLSAELITRWNSAASKLESANLAIDSMDDYLHAIWCSKEGPISKRSLYRVAAKLTHSDDLKEFVKDLDTYCDSYLAVASPSQGSSLSEDLRDLRGLNVQSAGFLTMVHRHFNNRFKEAVGLVLSLQIRNITVGPHQANVYEKDWPKWARLVRNGDAEQAFAEIRSQMVSDEEFKQSFGRASAASSITVRHLLRRLDSISTPGSGVQPMEVDVEHVLPKSVISKLTKDKILTKNVKRWIQDLGYSIPSTSKAQLALGAKLDPFLNMLGNQALLNDKANRGARDLSFAKKKDYYKKQALELTKTLASHEAWGVKQIRDRQKTLAEKAPLIWPK